MLTPALYLATSGTTYAGREFNGLPFEMIRKALSASRARKKLLIIDCCFSGRALIGLGIMGGGVRPYVQDAIDRVEGTFVITSAGENQPSIAPPDEEFTAFTGALIHCLEAGIAVRPGLPLTLLVGHGSTS